MGQGKLLKKKSMYINKKINQGMFSRAYLGWALKSMSKILQYIAILCAKILYVTWALRLKMNFFT